MATVSPRHPGGRPRTHEPSDLFLRVSSLAKRRNLHLDELAERAGVTVACIYKLKDPKVSTAKAIADALGVTLDRLLRTRQAASPPARPARRPA
jgi:transcriptional regulator with XRE-family HTH domain